jgi:hypothetical protein
MMARMARRDPHTFAGKVAQMRKRALDGNRVMCVAGQPDTDDDEGLFSDIDENASAADIATAGKEYLDKYLAAPDEKDAHKNISRAIAMLSAALSRCARDGQNVSKIASGQGLAARR